MYQIVLVICFYKADTEGDTEFPLSLGWRCLSGAWKWYFPPLASSPFFLCASILFSNTLIRLDLKPVQFSHRIAKTTIGNSLPNRTIHFHKFLIIFLRNLMWDEVSNITKHGTSVLQIEQMYSSNCETFAEYKPILPLFFILLHFPLLFFLIITCNLVIELHTGFRGAVLKYNFTKEFCSGSNSIGSEKL